MKPEYMKTEKEAIVMNITVQYNQLFKENKEKVYWGIYNKLKAKNPTWTKDHLDAATRGMVFRREADIHEYTAQKLGLYK